MDRDYFLRRYEEELARARAATCESARQAHEELAQRFKEAADGQTNVPPPRGESTERQLDA